MILSVWLAFLTAAFLISIAPGAGAINTMNSGMQFGVKASLPGIMGLQLGYLVQIVVVTVGLGAILASSNTLFLVIKWVGALYLIWLGIQKWRDSSKVDSVETKAPQRGIFWQSFFVNLTNPKATVFLVALFPQFLNSQQPQAPQLIVMGATLLVADIIVMLGYATLASQFKAFISSPEKMRWVNRGFAVIFIAAGVFLALYHKN